MFNVIKPLVALGAFSFGTLAALPALSHEFWLEPKEFQVENGAPIAADLRNGENFKGITLPFFDSRSTRLEIWQDGSARVIAARNGDLPAVAIAATDGLATLVHETGLSTITYKDGAKFLKFVKHKDLEAEARTHAERGLPADGFAEVYKRFCKALVAIGAGKGADVVTGMETEFVALANPYTESGPLPVRLLYQGAPRPDAQIEVFERGADGTVTVSLLRTDALGEAMVPVKPAHDYLLDAVVLRVPDAARANDYKADWETLWASLTFSTP